jgi:hypothetical protein
MRRKISLFLVSLVLAAAIVVCVRFYSYVFAKTVSGKVVGVERVLQPSTIIQGAPGNLASQIFSFAIAIQDDHGELHTATSEDRQWAVVQKDQCAEAKFFPYPPWDLSKGGTYFGARLIRLWDCK